MPRGRPGRAEAPGVERGLQSGICGERRSCRRASWGVAVSQGLLTDLGDRARAKSGVCGIGAMFGQSHEASRRMRIRTGGGQVTRDGIAPVTDVGKGRRGNHDFSWGALAKVRMRLLGKLRKRCHGYRLSVAPVNT